MSINLKALCFHILAQLERVSTNPEIQPLEVGIREATVDIAFTNPNGAGAIFELSPTPISLELAYARAQELPDILVDITLSSLRHARRSSIGRLIIQLSLAERRAEPNPQAALQPQE